MQSTGTIVSPEAFEKMTDRQREGLIEIPDGELSALQAAKREDRELWWIERAEKALCPELRRKARNKRKALARRHTGKTFR